jgi:hypothetical protein
MILLVKPEIKLIIRDPMSADVNLSIVRTSLQRSTNINIAALMTKIKRPKVRMTAGSVKSFNTKECSYPEIIPGTALNLYAAHDEGCEPESEGENCPTLH